VAQHTSLVCALVQALQAREASSGHTDGLRLASNIAHTSTPTPEFVSTSSRPLYARTLSTVFQVALAAPRLTKQWYVDARAVERTRELCWLR
jgi:hypothetical protein